MRLSAIDCVGRGVTNLRAHWELVLVYLAQSLVCAVLSLVGGLGLILLVGASFLFEVGNARDWSGAIERLEGLSIDGGLVAIALAAGVILVTVVGLVYSWFQAGIVTTLERGERQAPVRRRVAPLFFRTFAGRSFVGWSHRGAWRFFGLFCLVVACAAVMVGLYLLAVGVSLVATGQGGSPGAVIGGCLALLPLVGFLLLFQLWFLVSMTLAARDGASALRAAREGLAVLGGRLGGALLIILLFVIASLTVGLLFFPLTQGMAVALADSAVASFAVRSLLTMAQWLVNGILTVALFASVVALARSEVDRRSA